MPAGGARVGAGRKKGVPNKTTRLAKEAIAQAFERNGGVNRLVEWIAEDPQNERVFFGQVYPKLLPLQVNGEHELNVNVTGALSWKPPQ